jgi:hypothetical protein
MLNIYSVRLSDEFKHIILMNLYEAGFIVVSTL